MNTLRIALFLLSGFLPVAAFSATAPAITEATATPSGANGQVQLSAKITANGAVTDVTFRYGLGSKFDSQTTQFVPADSVERLVQFPLESLVGGETYQFRVLARNVAGRTRTDTPDPTFVVPAYTPLVSTRTPTNVRGGIATLRGVVTMNGTPGTARFEYGLTTSYGMEVDALDREGNPVDLTGKAIGRLVFAEVSDLERNKTYNFRLIVEDPAGVRLAATPNATLSNTNLPPIAEADDIAISGHEPVSIAVLANDSDPDGDAIKLGAVTGPQAGAAAKNGRTIIYTPASGFRGSDTFTYTIKDEFGAKATGTVTIRSPITAVAGWRGGLVQDAEGNVVGAFRLTATATGSFTGKVEIEGDEYDVRGVFDLNGRFRGLAFDGDDILPVEFQVVQEDGGTTITGRFGDGRWSSSAEVSQFALERRLELAGRYTVQLPAAAGTGAGTENDGSLPQGDGWISIKVTDYGEIQLKGKAGDGRDFSAGATLGVVGEQPAVSFYATPESSVLTGTLILGDTVTGQIAWSREETDATYYPDGFEVTIDAAGAKYLPPEKHVRALETGEPENDLMTITISGGDVPGVTHSLEISENDGVTVLDPGPDGLNLELDRKTGIFKGKFRFGDDQERRAKITGVLLQNEGVGRGVFLGFRETGKVELAISSDSTTPPPTTPPPTTIPIPEVAPDVEL